MVGVPPRAALPPPDRRHPRASSELVAAIGSLYERAGMHHHAVTLMSRRFRRKVERRSGLAWKRDSLQTWVATELGPEAARAFERIWRRSGDVEARRGRGYSVPVYGNRFMRPILRDFERIPGLQRVEPSQV